MLIELKLKYPSLEVMVVSPISGSFIACVTINVNSEGVLHCRLDRVLFTIGLKGAATNSDVVKVSLTDHNEANNVVVS